MQEILISENAISKVSSLLAKEENSELKLRVFITGGGCNGFSYGFTFDEEMNDDDAVVYSDDFFVLVDAMSYPYLVGAEIDYIEDLSGSQFSVTNPNEQERYAILLYIVILLIALTPVISFLLMSEIFII